MLSRHTRAAIAAGAAGAAYYAASALASRRPVRLGGLLVLSLGALAGQVAQSSRASAKAYEVEGRLNQFFTSGGQVGGDLHITGDHYVSGQSHTHLTAPPGSSNVQVQGGSGLGILTGHLDMNSNQMVNVSGVNDPQYWVPPTGGGQVVLAGGEIWMNGATIDCGHGEITKCAGVTS